MESFASSRPTGPMSDHWSLMRVIDARMVASARRVTRWTAVSQPSVPPLGVVKSATQSPNR